MHRAQELTFMSEFRAEHFPAAPQQISIEPYASSFPFSYSASDAVDLGRTKERHYSDPEHKIDEWARALLQEVPEARTLDALTAMTAAIKERFRYIAREAPGMQTPLETLELGSGSCRDFALFMMEAARSLGLAARFVSGYLYDERLSRCRRGNGRRWSDARVGADLSARRRMGRIRSDQCTGRWAETSSASR